MQQAAVRRGNPRGALMPFQSSRLRDPASVCDLIRWVGKCTVDGDGLDILS